MMCVYRVLLLFVLSSNFAEYTQIFRCGLFVSILLPCVNLQDALVTLGQAGNSHNLMRYCDIDNSICHCQDPFMNRIVAIVEFTRPDVELHFRWGEVITTGVFINNSHVLSSYNPFRNMRKNVTLDRMYVYYYVAQWHHHSEFTGYLLRAQKFSCARQVVPMLHHAEEQWHGSDQLHSPVHDLIVFKTTANFSMNGTWSEEDLTKRNYSLIYNDDLVTKLAGPDDYLSDNLTFVSLGFTDEDHIRNRNHLHTVGLDREDRVLMNCDEWFIRSWGYFICVRNVGEYIGIGSGAFLFSESKVFGVGSFALKKGNDSILVFTDVRPYYKAIHATCTEKDGH